MSIQKPVFYEEMSNDILEYDGGKDLSAGQIAGIVSGVAIFVGLCAAGGILLSSGSFSANVTSNVTKEVTLDNYGCYNVDGNAFVPIKTFENGAAAVKYGIPRGYTIGRVTGQNGPCGFAVWKQ